jgi:hypothetical protein
MILSKLCKAITFTTIISLSLATASSSVKAATLTLASQSGEIQINNDITISDLGADVLSLSSNNPGVIIINYNSNVTPGVLTVDNSNLSGGSISPAGDSITIRPVGSGGNISISLVSLSVIPTGGNISITTGNLTVKSTPEPTSLKSFAILGLGCLLLRFKKITEKKRG